jgi:XTP/dITP diphosphohydrolase
MRELLFATHNANKIREVRALLPRGFSILGLNDIHWTYDIPEPFHTFEENARAKAMFVFDRTGLSCFADDSGLRVDALNGRPGVFSARYAGPGRSSKDNIVKLLDELGETVNRRARFHAMIAYIEMDGSAQLFEGVVEGRIAYEARGAGGFGYDPVFIPEGFDRTFGELADELKNKISHRALAIHKFIQYIRSQP